MKRALWQSHRSLPLSAEPTLTDPAEKAKLERLSFGEASGFTQAWDTVGAGA